MASSSDDISSDSDSGSNYSSNKSNRGLDLFDLSASVASVFELQSSKQNHPELKRRGGEFIYRQQTAVSAQIKWRCSNTHTGCTAAFYTDYGKQVFESTNNPKHC
jgi:hypothetical protein